MKKKTSKKREEERYKILIVNNFTENMSNAFHLCAHTHSFDWPFRSIVFVQSLDQIRKLNRTFYFSGEENKRFARINAKETNDDGEKVCLAGRSEHFFNSFHFLFHSRSFCCLLAATVNNLIWSTSTANAFLSLWSRQFPHLCTCAIFHVSISVFFVVEHWLLGIVEMPFANDLLNGKFNFDCNSLKAKLCLCFVEHCNILFLGIFLLRSVKMISCKCFVSVFIWQLMCVIWSDINVKIPQMSLTFFRENITKQSKLNAISNKP